VLRNTLNETNRDIDKSKRTGYEEEVVLDMDDVDSGALEDEEED
jgi:hypothetical protein